MISLVACIVLAQADGGTPFPVSDAGVYSEGLYSTCPNAPPVQVLDGGWVLASPERAARNACIAATCEFDRKRRAENQAAAPTPPSWVSTVAAAISAAIIGFTVGKAVK